jgi:hypothetical protein
MASTNFVVFSFAYADDVDYDLFFFDFIGKTVAGISQFYFINVFIST